MSYRKKNTPFQDSASPAKIVSSEEMRTRPIMTKEIIKKARLILKTANSSKLLLYGDPELDILFDEGIALAKLVLAQKKKKGKKYGSL